jgi:dihydrofolate reductase
MIVSLIAAMAENRVIGIENKLPWKLPADMKWFREKTMGKPIVMGRKTFESFGAKPLPGRTNIIVTRDKNYQAENCIVVNSFDDALEAAHGVDEVMIIGGASFYAQTLPYADRIYLTVIHQEFEGDAWFPAYESTRWQESTRIDCKADEKNPYDYSFLILERRKNTV